MTDELCSFFFFKQKTAYEMRISDWSSDVCSSDLGAMAFFARRQPRASGAAFVDDEIVAVAVFGGLRLARRFAPGKRRQVGKERIALDQIGRASCRERVCQYV